MTDKVKSVIAGIFSDLAYNNPLLFFHTLTPTRSFLKPISPYLHQAELLSKVQLRRPVRVFIADEIGLGKTIEALVIARYLQEKGEVKRALVLVPRVLIKQWEFELQRVGISPTDIRSIERDSFERLSRLGFPEGKFYLASIDLVKRDEYERVLRKLPWDLVIVDEAHNLGKGTKRRKLVKELVAGSEEAKRRHVLFLSATPHRGDSPDYISRLQLLDPTLHNLSSLDDREFYGLTHNVLIFRRSKEVVNEVEGRRVFPDCNFYAVAVQPTDVERRFSEMLTDFLKLKLSKHYTDHLSLEALLTVIIRKRASSSPYAALRTFENMIRGMERRTRTELRKLEEESASIAEKIFGLSFDELEEYGGDDLDESVAELAERCSIVLDDKDKAYLEELTKLAKEVGEHDTKAEAVIGLVEKYLNEGKKIVIFTEYRDTLEYLKDKFDSELGSRYGRFFVTISGRDRSRLDEVKRRFEGEEKTIVLLATDVISEGLNLQIASVAINYEAPWSPIKLEQRIGRIWRIGQREDVDVYTMFTANRMDLDVLDNLYRKLMNIREALGDIRPVLGEKVYKVKASSARDLWKYEGHVESVELNGKRKRVTEYELILAAIRGELHLYTNALIAILNSLNFELRTKRIYPYVKAINIVENVRKWCSFENRGEFEEIITRLAVELGLRSTPEKIRETIVSILRSFSTDIGGYPQYLMLPGDEGEDYVLKVQVKDTEGKVIYEEPIVYNKAKEILRGTKLIDYLIGLLRSGAMIPDEVHNMDELPLTVKAAVKRRIRDTIYSISEEIYQYEGKSTERGWKGENLFKVGEVSVEHVLTVVHLRYLESELPISPFRKEKVEKAAMEMAMEYERKNGRDPKDVSRFEHYDIRSKDERGKTRYIEVKGHWGRKIYGELTEDEFNFAEKSRDKYWLYIVYDIGTDSPKLLCFRDPINTMRIETELQRRYRLFPA